MMKAKRNYPICIAIAFSIAALSHAAQAQERMTGGTGSISSGTVFVHNTFADADREALEQRITDLEEEIAGLNDQIQAKETQVANRRVQYSATRSKVNYLRRRYGI